MLRVITSLLANCVITLPLIALTYPAVSSPLITLPGIVAPFLLILRVKVEVSEGSAFN